MDLKQTVLGIEFGSTRIKAVLIDREHRVLAQGSHRWENRLDKGIWIYPMEEILSGLRSCYQALRQEFEARYAMPLTGFGALGVSAMMHGYLPLDAEDQPLTAFRTWRNTMTGEAAAELTELFSFRIPQRWTVAHLYQAILSGEAHVPYIRRLATLAVYIHYRLSGRFVAGFGEASGIVPLDSCTGGYDERMLATFDALVEKKHYPWRLRELLPEPLKAEENAGCLTAEGVRLLDPDGVLEPGVPLCPCEGDADTGLVATNCLRPGCCSVSAGTSSFAMLVADRPLGIHREADYFCTPSGRLTAMIHSSNCSTEINAWMGLFREFAAVLGRPVEDGELYRLLFTQAAEGALDSGGMLCYPYHSGENVPGVDEGRPLLVRRPGEELHLKDFMRCQLMSALSSLHLGLRRMEREEGLRAERAVAQGGLFKTPRVAQRLLSSALGAPVSVMQTAGEGGAWGMALLGAYLLWGGEHESLEDYLDTQVFSAARLETICASEDEISGFARYARRMYDAIGIEQAAISLLE